MNDTVAVLALCRFGQDAAAMGLWGAWATLAWLVPPSLAATLDRGARRWTRAALAVLALAVAAELPALAASIGGDWHGAVDPALVGSVLADTAPGRAWTARVAAILLVLAARGAPRRMRAGATAVAGGLFLAGLALSGHAAMHEGALGRLHRANDVVHVLSAGAWLGALVPVLSILRLFDEPRWRYPAATALRRFSRAGHVAVALALLSGAANAGLILGRWPLDPRSPYVTLLDAKILAVAALVGLAVLNRYVLVPRLRQSPEAALAGLRRATLAELPLGLAAIALVAVFGQMDPG